LRAGLAADGVAQSRADEGGRWFQIRVDGRIFRLSAAVDAVHYNPKSVTSLRRFFGATKYLSNSLV
jgi:hypothetical protein